MTEDQYNNLMVVGATMGPTMMLGLLIGSTRLDPFYKGWRRYLSMPLYTWFSCALLAAGGMVGLALGSSQGWVSDTYGALLMVLFIVTLIALTATLWPVFAKSHMQYRKDKD